MRKLSLLLTLLGVLLTPALNAQYSLFKTMSYQGVARNASGTPVANQAISVRFQLQYGLSDAYIETQSLTTNAFGVFSAQIGDGTPVGGAFPSYDAIDWWGGYAAGLQVWIDITGGTNYVQAGGTSLRSVPFAALSEQSFALLDSSLYSSPTRVFMKPTARMGLGTETPQSLVDVEGGMAIGATYSGTTAAPANGLIVEGNVGFGTTAPGSLLQVGSYLTASDNYITVASEGGNLWRSGLRLRHYNSQNGYTIESDERGATLGLNVLDHAESLTGTSCLFIQKGSGNVGLSTTTPVNKIDVEGGAAIGATYSGTTAAPTNGLIVEGNTGIGTNDPQAKLHVAGTTRLVDGTQGAGKVLTSDASGNAAWSTVVSSGSYTPTLSGSSGFISVDGMACEYNRVGSLVTVVCATTASGHNFGAGTNIVNLSVPPSLPVLYNAGNTLITGTFASDRYRNLSDTSIGLVAQNSSTSVRLMVKNSTAGFASAFCTFTYKTSAP